MADDVYAWLNDPASNQGWFFSFAPPASGQFNARSSRAAEGTNVTPLLAITYSVAEGPPVTTIALDEPVTQQDGFDLSWITSLVTGDNITRYVVAWSGGGESGTVETTGTSLNLRSHHFTYGTNINITVRGYDGTDLIATSNQRTAAIVDNRSTTASLNSFTHTWSAVYGAAEYRLEFGASPDFTAWDASDYELVPATNTTGTISGLSQATWHYRVIAIGSGDEVLRTGAVRSVAVAGPTVTLTSVTPGEDHFTLAWTHQGTMDTFTVVYIIDGGTPITVTNVASSPITIGNAEFYYGLDIEFVVHGYVGTDRIGSSLPMSAQILDRRVTRAFHDGFSYTWSAVYGAEIYVIEYWLDGTTTRTTATVTPPSTTFTIRDDNVFSEDDVWHFEVRAYSTLTAEPASLLRTAGGTVTIPEFREPADIEPQTVTLRPGVDGYDGVLHVGFMMPNNGNLTGSPLSEGIHLGSPDGRALIYFDLEGVIPTGVDRENIFVTSAVLSLYQANNVSPARDAQLHRVLDPDNMGMWYAGTNNSGVAWNPSNRNDGASWRYRDNGFEFPGRDAFLNPGDDTCDIPAPLVRPRRSWTASGGFLGDSVASAPSAISHVPNRSPFANNQVDFADVQLTMDVNAWLQDPASNQGWMISVVGGNTNAGPHFWGSQRNPVTQRPMLTITFFDLTDIGDDAFIFLADVNPDEDGFFLQWFSFGAADNFVVEYSGNGITGTVPTTETSIWIRNSDFVYDEDFTFKVYAYSGNTRLAESYERIGQIVDNRSFVAREDGIDVSWSRVYGAHDYRVEVRRADNVANLIFEEPTGTSVSIDNATFFTFGYYEYRVIARDASAGVLRDTGWIPFERPDVTPPVTVVSVQGGANYAYTPTDALLLPPNRGPVTIAVVSASDAESGVARTEFRFNNDFRNTFQVNNPSLATNTQNDAPGAEWVMDPWHSVSVGGTVTVSAQGVTRVRVRSVDHAGNVEMSQPIYIVIDNSDLVVNDPVVTSGGVPRTRLVAGETIDITTSVFNDHDTIGLDAFLMVALFDASGRMVEVEESPPVTINAGTSGTVTATMALPGNVAAGWHLDILLLEAGTFNPIHSPHVFPHQLNIHQHTLPWRPMVNSLEVTSAPPVITQQPRGLMIVNSEIEPGETFELTVLAESIDDGNLTYQWYVSVNGAPFTQVPGATSATHIMEFDDVANLNDNDTFEFYVRVTNTRAGTIRTAYVLSHTVMVSIVDEITYSDLGYRVVLADTLAADIGIMLGDHDDAELLAFTANWFKDMNGVWRDATGLALADGEPEALVIHRYIMHPRYAVPTELGLDLDMVAPISASNYTAYITMRELHSEVVIESTIPDGAVWFFAMETVDMTLNEVDPADRVVRPVFPADRTEMTPVDQPAAIAYALAGDRVMLYLYGATGNFIQSFEIELIMGPDPDGPIVLRTYPDTSDGSIILYTYTMTGTRDNLTPTVISDDTIVRVRYSDGTFYGGQMIMQYGDLVRDTVNHSHWVLSGLEAGVEYSSLSGSAQGYEVYFIPYIPMAVFTVTIVVQPPNSGNITGLATDGLYQRGQTASLTAVPASGYRFAGWFDDSNELITANPQLSFEVNYDVELEARFVTDDGIRTFFLQNGRPWIPFNDTDLYTRNTTRNGLFDGAIGNSPTGAGNPTTDLFIWNRNPAGSNFAQWVQQSLIHFDLDGYLPQGVEGVDFVIEEARLHLAHNRMGPQGGTADLDVFRLLDPNESGIWDRTGPAGSTSWRYKSQAGGGTPWFTGGSIDDVRVLSYTIEDVDMENPTPNWLIADVTDDVAAWARGDLYNMGWLLRQNNAVASTTSGLANNPGAIVISNAANTAGWAPMLEIVYRIIFEPVDTQTISGSFGVINPHLNVRVALMDGTTEVSHQIVNAGIGTTVDFTFANVAPGTYSLLFTRPGHTRFTVYNVVVTAGSDIDLTQEAAFPAVLPLWPGDMNGDDVIDIADLQLFTTLMLAGNASADLNGDGFVNAFDRNLLMAHIGRESEYIILP